MIYSYAPWKDEKTVRFSDVLKGYRDEALKTDEIKKGPA